jgi:hypothetical protein
MFFEEVTSYLTAHPQSTINDIRFVAYSGDQATVDAFLGLLSSCYLTRDEFALVDIDICYNDGILLSI